MTRPAFHHIAWAKVEPALRRFNLADSAVATPDLEALGLPHQAGLQANVYTQSLPHLESALAARVGAPEGRVVVTAGASEANACVYRGLLEPGDQVLVEDPSYEPLRALAPFFGLDLARFARDRARGFAGFVPAVEAAITPRTRMVAVTHLHNPSSAALAESDADALNELAERHGFWILCDETYRDGGPFPLGTMLRGPRWVGTSSLTKAYGLGGLRIGWIAGSSEALAASAAAQNGLSSDPSTPSIALAAALVPHLDRLRERSRKILEANHAKWNAFAARFRASAEGTNGGAAAFDPGPAPLGNTTWCLFAGGGEGDRFVAFAAERFDLAVTPGRFFGDPRGVRVSLGSEPERFAAALDQFESALHEFVSIRAGSGAPA